MTNGTVFRLGQPKEYSNETVHNKSTVGLLLDMDKGNLSFTLDGKNLGVVSRDKRLLTGKWFSAILLQDAGD